jgi:hypothetical protein
VVQVLKQRLQILISQPDVIRNFDMDRLSRLWKKIVVYHRNRKVTLTYPFRQSWGVTKEKSLVNFV